MKTILIIACKVMWIFVMKLLLRKETVYSDGQ